MLCEHIIFYLATSEQALQHVAMYEVTVDASRQGIQQSERLGTELQGIQKSVTPLPAAFGKTHRPCRGSRDQLENLTKRHLVSAATVIRPVREVRSLYTRK